MSDVGVARLPSPPYDAVMFSSRRAPHDQAGYDAAEQRMLELAAVRPGFPGVESACDAEAFGVTVSYWASDAATGAWRGHAEDADARHTGRERWYEHFELCVARVERADGPGRAAS